MSNRAKRAGCRGVGILLVVGLAALAGAEAHLRDQMRQIFGSLQVLLPAAVAGQFSDPARADEIKTALRALEERGTLLDNHGQGLDPGARLFGQALAQDARRALDFFERGRFDNAAFYVESLVDDCVACHTRLPAVDVPWTDGFLERAELAALAPLERAQVQVATRQFGRALETYETVLRAPNQQMGVMLGPLSNYLRVAVRVQRDPERPRELLAHLAQRERIPETLRGDLEHWRDRLEGTAPGDLRGSSLDEARQAIGRADDAARYPGDPRALVDYLVASSQLNELLTMPQDSPSDAAEIYYHLGRAELGIGRGAWLPRAELFLETAIRLAPGQAIARDAFALLEGEVHAGYTGSGGLRLPAEETVRLAELRSLSEGGALDSPANLDLAQTGERLFERHCSLCHGVNARGDGPLAGTLMTLPEDLTTIASRRGGDFPSAEIRALIDGRDPLGSHRSPEMPRWGEYWAEPSKLDAVVLFLRGIQR